MSSPIPEIPGLTGDFFISPSGVYATAPGSGPVFKDSISLFEFLQQIDTTKADNKRTSFDSQAVQAIINREYFLGVAQQLQVIAEKYKQSIVYAGSIGTLIDNYNASVNNVNNAIATYNATTIPNLNAQIAAMNNAIATINSIPSPTPAQIATYNAAVATFNNYLNSTGNPGLALYASQAASLYNNPTATANNVTIPAINQIIDELNLGIPHVAPFTPSTAPAGTAPLPNQANYAGSTIPLIPIPPFLPNFLSTVPPAQSKEDIIQTYFLPYANELLAAMAATSKKLTNQDQVIAFINFFVKQGFKLDPAKVDAFILEGNKPSIPSDKGSSASGGASLSMFIGTDTPNLQRILSITLFRLISAQAQTPIPPQIYDQVNVFVAALLQRIGASAGLSVIAQLGDTLKSLPKDSSVIDLAIAAAILQNTLAVISEGKALEALTAIFKGIPNISQSQAEDLARQLLKTQNLSLLLNAGLSVGVATKSPELIQSLLNVSVPAVSQESPQAALNRSLNENFAVVQTRVTSLLESGKTSPIQASALANRSLEAAKAELAKNAPIPAVQQAIADSLSAQNVPPPEAQTLSQNIIATVISLAPPPPAPVVSAPVAPASSNPQDLKPGDVINQLQANIQNVLKSDLTNSLPKIVSQTLVASLTDTKNPHSWVSMTASVLNDLKKYNDTKIADEIEKIQNEFKEPHVELAVLSGKIRDPAYNILLSFMEGPMYDNKIPTNWQRPLSIQI